MLCVAPWSVVLAANSQIPPALESWQNWVLHGEEFLECPMRVGAPFDSRDGHVCAWPGTFRLNVAAGGARFEQQWQVYADSWLPLPGGGDHWPSDVRIGDRPAVVLDRDGIPSIRVEAGSHRVVGKLVWTTRPDALAVPRSVALVELTLDGRPVELPDRHLVDGAPLIRLGERSESTERAHLDLRVSRLLEDGVPARLETRLELRVAGAAREIELERVVPDGFVVYGIDSDLPVRLEGNARLRLQVRRGLWPIVLRARANGVVDAIALPAQRVPWPQTETLSFQPNDALRVVTLEGATPVDPARAGVPAEWHGLTAFVLEPGAQIELMERSRGLAGDAGTTLSLERDLWLDFAHDRWLARDRLRGQLSGRWRLEMAPPFELASVASRGQQLLVTRSEADAGGGGVEVRGSEVDLDALATLAVHGDELPVTGWQHELEGAAVTLHLPPGHRLIAALGVDESYGDWVSRWSLLDIFVTLLVTVAAFRLLGTVGALVALPALALGYHETAAPTWLWVNLILAVALVRALPDGRLRRWAVIWRSLSFVVAMIALLPFAFLQLRLALYPQLATGDGGVQDAPARELLAPAAPPAADVPQDATEEIMVTASRRKDLVEGQTGPDRTHDLVYPPGVVTQTGPPRPAWTYVDYGLRYGGPVSVEQTMRLLIAPPWALSALRILSVAFALLLLLLLAAPPRAWPPRGSPAARPRSTLMILAASAFALVSLSMAPRARAELPSPALLAELKARLSEAPPCAPACVSLATARLDASDDELAVTLDLQAAARSAFPLPVPGQNGYWSSAAGGSQSVPIVASDDGQSWALVEPGIQRVRVTVSIGSRSEIKVRFPQAPKSIVIAAPGWVAAGATNGRLLSDTLTLSRIAKGADREASAGRSDAAALAAFVRVERNIELDLDWRMRTRVLRVASGEGGLSVEVPLLSNESVTRADAGIAISGRRASVSLSAGESATGWDSALEAVPRLELEAPRGADWAETWRIAASPALHVEFSGTPEIASDGLRGRTFAPRPGERLIIEVHRPEALDGAALVLDRVAVEHRFGERSVASAIHYAYRSTQGGRELITLPDGATLEALEVDGRTVALRQESNQLALPVQPGEHQVVLRVATAADLATKLATPRFDLGAPAGNLDTRVELPANRWILAAWGSGVGPAILYWSELLAFVIVAVLLGRHPRSPLRMHEWLLLGLGLSTFSWGVLLLFAIWLFAIEWRSQTRVAARLPFNALQIALAVLSVAALSALLGAIPNGLLGTPDMRIDGAGSYATSLAWFDDLSSGELPPKSVVAVSIWWYKAAMLAWALWLSFALVRWMPWAWRAFATGGYWQRGSRRRANVTP
jgi:hypothetical protein